MRTTVDIPDPMYRQLKSKAALRGCSVKQLILRGVEIELQGSSAKARNQVRFPVIRSKRPGWLKLTNEQINEILLP